MDSNHNAKMKKYNAIIIGSGSIGCTKPDKYDSPETENVLTMAHAFYSHPQINLIGIVDIDRKKAQAACRKWKMKQWKGKSYLDIDEIREQIDIVAVCVPTPIHAAVLLSILPHKPKLVITEKPFCSDIGQAELIIEAYQEAKIPLMIDFIRRYDTTVRAVAEALQSGESGEILSCKVMYNRGFIREGCHALDLCNLFFGKFIEGKILSDKNAIIDFDKKDPTYPVYISYEKCKNIHFIPVDGRICSVFEIDIMTEKARFLFTEHGLYLNTYPVAPEKIYGDYNSLSSDCVRIATRLSIALLNLVQNAIDHIEQGTPILCTAQDGLEIHKIYREILE